MTKMGQNTGMLKQSKKVHINAITVLLVTEYQNLNSGNRLTKGLNSSFALVGSSGPFSSAKIEKVSTQNQCFKTLTIEIHSWVYLRR